MKNDLSPDNALFDNIALIIEQSRRKVAATVNLTMLLTYFDIGRMIVEDEQQGKERAVYGKNVLKNLAQRLTEHFGKGFSVDNLQNMRQFYLTYSIYETASRKFILSWSHYLVLMRLANPDERSFYEIEAAANQWSLKELKRQYSASLYERLALSRNKEEARQLATQGNTIERPQDILKNPLTLEFLGLEDKPVYSESDLENAIISKIQQFLLELGKGFLFEARQKRFTFDEKHFKIDLVLYNRLLQSYVLIDLKTDELMHQDIGQMQMYVNYYDRFVKLETEKPTIGILLCKEKNDAIVELTLPFDANIYAAEYTLYLPDKSLLQQKLKEWLTEFDNLNNH